VRKIAARAEPELMMFFPDVFVPILSIGDGDPTVFTMPLCREPHIEQRRFVALSEGIPKLRLLWGVSRMPRVFWKSELHSHLFAQILKHKLNVNPNLVLNTLDCLPDIDPGSTIHGDATLANMVCMNGNDWRWIDPLDRPYIPGDPHVDLGKMFQSCWDYELVLLGQKYAKFDHDQARQLAVIAGLDYHKALNWCIIHLIRLLPYQDERVRGVYERVLDSL
jgi:hypothetical protein